MHIHVQDLQNKLRTKHVPEEIFPLFDTTKGEAFTNAALLVLPSSLVLPSEIYDELNTGTIITTIILKITKIIFIYKNQVNHISFSSLSSQ